MNPTINVSRGTVIGIGKAKIPRTSDFDHEIPMLSFLVIRESETSFISTCIHLRIDGYGNTPKGSMSDMVENAYHFLHKNFERLSPEDAWDNIRSLYKTDAWSNELWDAYHEIQIQSSIQGKSLDNVSSLWSRLERLAGRVKQLESLEKYSVLDEIEKLAYDLIVDYTPFDEAA